MREIVEIGEQIHDNIQAEQTGEADDVRFEIATNHLPIDELDDHGLASVRFLSLPARSANKDDPC
jgi:hypothetical protein